MPSLLLEKASMCRNDWLPSSAIGFGALSAGLVLLFRICGHLLAPDSATLLASHDWTYHSFWLPLHLVLARCASKVFARHATAARADLGHDLSDELTRRVSTVTSLRGFVGGLLLVAPLVILDVRAGIEYVDENHASQGAAATLIPMIWMLEWLATAQIWLYVLGSIYITPLASHAQSLRGRHVDILVHGKGRESIKAGLENAMIIAAYGLSTVGYVWYANGQTTDYLVLALSTVLVLVCFFSALVQLKVNLRKTLDDLERPIVELIDGRTTATREPPGNGVAYHFVAESTEAIYAKRFSRDRATDARIRLLRLATCLPLTGKDDRIDKQVADRLRVLIECEFRLSELGVGELWSLGWRAGMPILAVAGKSLSGLVGVH